QAAFAAGRLPLPPDQAGGLRRPPAPAGQRGVLPLTRKGGGREEGWRPRFAVRIGGSLSVLFLDTLPPFDHDTKGWPGGMNPAGVRTGSYPACPPACPLLEVSAMSRPCRRLLPLTVAVFLLGAATPGRGEPGAPQAPLKTLVVY